MIEVRNLHFAHGAQRILQGIDLNFAGKKRTILLGRSGSGKSTLLRLLNRLLEPAAGEIFFNGQPITALDTTTLRRTLGFVPQRLGLFPHWTARRQIERFLDSSIDLNSLSQSLGLSPAELERFPHQLSGGQQQRVALARALASNPPVLLLDEPFSALDPPLRRELQDLILSLDKTILFVTHDLREALRLGDHIVFLSEGQIAFAGPPGQLSNSLHPEVQTYLASLDV